MVEGKTSTSIRGKKSTFIVGVLIFLSSLLLSDWKSISQIQKGNPDNTIVHQYRYNNNDNSSNINVSSSSSSINDKFIFSSSFNVTTNNNKNEDENIVKERKEERTHEDYDDHDHDSQQRLQEEDEIQQIDKEIPILVDLRGELGNHLLHLAHGRTIQIMLNSQYNISSKLLLVQKSTDSKYLKTLKNLQECFPTLREMKFYKPNSKEIQQSKMLLSQQKQFWFDPTAMENNNNNKNNVISSNSKYTTTTPWKISQGTDYDATKEVVDRLANIILSNRKDGQLASLATTTKTNITSSSSSSSSILTVPYIHTNNMINRAIMNIYYDDFRSYFKFDDERCCTDIPQRDEIVFHFRNFVGELHKQGKSTGLEELSPNKTSNELFAPTKTNLSKIVIATRMPYHNTVQEYVTSLSSSSSSSDNQQQQSRPRRQVRVFTNHTAVQDFCAMTKATELVGMVRSTFVVFAALLGDGQARLYSVDSLMLRRRIAKKNPKLPIFRTYNWTHPELQRRIKFELYNAEDVE